MPGCPNEVFKPDERSGHGTFFMRCKPPGRVVYIAQTSFAPAVDPSEPSSSGSIALWNAFSRVFSYIFEWRRKTEFSADSDFVFASPYMAREKPYTPWNMQHNQLSPAAVKAGLGPIGWHTLRHTYRAWLGDNGDPLTVQKELMRHASIQTTLNTYWGRDDGLDAGSAWTSSEAGDGALMDASGRQPIG